MKMHGKTVNFFFRKSIEIIINYFTNRLLDNNRLIVAALVTTSPSQHSALLVTSTDAAAGKSILPGVSGPPTTVAAGGAGRGGRAAAGGAGGQPGGTGTGGIPGIGIIGTTLSHDTTAINMTCIVMVWYGNHCLTKKNNRSTPIATDIKSVGSDIAGMILWQMTFVPTYVQLLLDPFFWMTTPGSMGLCKVFYILSINGHNV